MGRFRGLRPDESLLERRRSPDGPDRPLGLRRSGQPDVRRHARNARPRDLHQRDEQLLRRMAGHRGAETHRPPRHRRKAQRRRRILSGQAFEIRHLGLRKHEHAAAQRLLPARQRQEQRHFGRNLRQLRQKLGQALPLRQRRAAGSPKTRTAPTSTTPRDSPTARRPTSPSPGSTPRTKSPSASRRSRAKSVSWEPRRTATTTATTSTSRSAKAPRRSTAPTTAGRRHGAPAWRGTSTTNPSCAIRTF